jgi:hypothetical protein
MEVPGCNQPVSSVISFARDDDDFFFFEERKEALEYPEDLKAGILHQDRTGDADLLNRLTVDLLHLLRCQDFHVRFLWPEFYHKSAVAGQGALLFQAVYANLSGKILTL